MTLSTVWFVIVAFFWTGFFVLEGFDFGVGALHKVVGRTDVERRVAINTIGPVWDGNEVWLVVAGASMFAAFPNWYASWFSALYLALWLLLAALIVRGVSFEFRGKFDRPGWRATWSWTLTIGSVVAPLLLGVGLGDLLAGLPIDTDGNFTGSFVDLLTPFGLFLGITLLVLCVLHGSTFLSIRSTGVVRLRAQEIARQLSIPAAALVAGFVVWAYALARPGNWAALVLAVPIVAVAVTVVLVLGGHAGGRAFAATAVTIGGVVASLFATLYPRLLVSTTAPENTLTVANSTASAYSLQVMSIVALVMVPLVLLYQGWTYYVFRARIRTPPEPAADPVPSTS
ncbi:MAG TPA: cytochrome d ubiquinol oxidase subunit II [Nakamurella sp.]